MVPGDTDDGMIWVFSPRDNPDKIGTHAEPDPEVEALKKSINRLSRQLLHAVGEENLEAFIYNWSKNNATWNNSIRNSLASLFGRRLCRTVNSNKEK